ncbi:MAG: polyprenyl synthetase family protein [Acidobacteriota bacterium]|nr:polyprenyl synthetase family protein [Acidobacteriota bacterium]
MSELRTFFTDCSKIVEKKLDALVPLAHIEPKKLHEAIRWSLLAGGKRFRPALLFAVGKTFGAENVKLLRTAAAIEMIHTYSLIHDDLPAMDDDDLRRGKATCHKKFGEATAILAGDVLQTLAFQAIAEDENLSAEIRVKLISELAKAAGTPIGMVAGQQFDLEAEGKSITIEQLEKIHHRKTGAMICGAARSGAIIAEANERELEAVSNYASELGLLFQITDDLLDVTQPTEVLGKTAGKDVSAEKATYPAFYGLEETRRLAENIYAKACQKLKKIDKETNLLSEIADFILKREK